jgi:hypothetical protein
MTTFYKDENGVVKQVVESKDVTIEELDEAIASLEVVLEEARNKRQQYLTVRDGEQAPVATEVVEPTPVEPAPAAEPTPEPTPEPVTEPATVTIEPAAPVSITVE